VADHQGGERPGGIRLTVADRFAFPNGGIHPYPPGLAA
jgi:hypothetical protein